MIYINKERTEQLLDFGDEYWFRTINEDELQKDRTYSQRIDGATYWNDWKKIDEKKFNEIKDEFEDSFTKK